MVIRKSSVFKKYNNTTHHSNTIIPVQASMYENEKEVHQNLQDKRQKRIPEFQLGQLVRTADIKKLFSKSESTNYSYKLYTIKDIKYDTNLRTESTYYQKR